MSQMRAFRYAIGIAHDDGWIGLQCYGISEYETGSRFHIRNPGFLVLRHDRKGTHDRLKNTPWTTTDGIHKNPLDLT
jgi:hypothetical protein